MSEGTTTPSALRPPQVSAQDTAIFDAGAASLNAPAGSGAFNVYRYPAELATDEHPHYVMFFITTRESDISANEVAKIGGNTTNFDQSQSNRISASTEAAVATGTVVVGANVLNGKASGDTPAVDQTVRVLASAGAAGAITADAIGGRDQVLLKEAIALYLNGKPSTTYNATWADEDMGMLGGILSQNKITGPVSAASALASMATRGSLAYILQNQEGTIAKQAAGAYQAAAGQAPNPFKAQLFKSMGFREFSFDYIFLPKNDAEYQQVKAIIQAFKLYMHPKFSGASKFMLNYPAEFNIVYYHKQSRNEELFRISNCALRNVSIEYGGTDFTTFRGTAGKPSEIAMKLSFVELEVLSRERIEAGF